MSMMKFYTAVITFCMSRDDAKCIVATAVRLSVCPSPHSHTTARTRM